MDIRENEREVSIYTPEKIRDIERVSVREGSEEIEKL